MPESNSTSGVFVQPRWKREPSDAERTMAVLMSLVPIAGLVLCTLVAGYDAPRVRSAADKLHKSAKSMGLALSAESGDAELAARAGGPSLGEKYAQGRQVMAESFASLGRDLRADRRYGQYLPWIGGGMLAGLGVIFCFFGWSLRRATSALYGAVALGYGFFLVAMKAAGMGPVPAALAALAPAFLGALVGWHMVVAVTCLQVGGLICLPAAILYAVSTGLSDLPPWFLPVTLSAWALVTALTYLFLVRAVLISGWSVGGGVAIAMGLITLLVAWKNTVLPWEASLAVITFFAILGTLAQYRHAGGPKDDAGDDPYDSRPPPRKPPPKLKPA
jgi:hypothetical protein